MTALQKTAVMDKYTCFMFCLQKIIDFHTEEDVQHRFQELCYELLLYHVITTTTATDRLKQLEIKVHTPSNALLITPLVIYSLPHVSSVTYCVIQHAMVCLAMNKKNDFFHIARALEQSPAISNGDRFRVWDNWFQYLASFGGLFLETSDKQSQEYDQRRHDLTTTTQWMTTSSLDFFADQYVQLVEQTDKNPSSSDDEKQYIRHASQQTVLRIFVNWGNTSGGQVIAIHRFLECFPSAFPAIAWGSGDEALISAAVDFLMNHEMEVPPSMLVEGCVDVTILEQRKILLTESETKHQQLMLETQEQLRSDSQARDLAIEQRRKWIFHHEHLEGPVEIENTGGNEDLQPREEHASMSFESQEENYATVNRTEGHSAADTEDDIVNSECEAENIEGTHDDVVEIDSSTDDEEGVQSVDEVVESEGEEEDEYSDDYNDDEEMSDAYDNQQQNDYTQDHIICDDENIVHMNKDDHSEQVQSVDNDHDSDEGRAVDDDEEDGDQRLDDQDEYSSDDDNPEDVIEEINSNDLDQEQLTYVEVADDDDYDDDHEIPRGIGVEEEEDVDDQIDNKVGTNIDKEHLAPIPADDAFDDVNNGSTSHVNIKMVKVVGSPFLDADSDNNDVVKASHENGDNIDDDDDEKMTNVVASEVLPRRDVGFVEIVGDEYDDCDARVLEGEIEVVVNVDKGNEVESEEGGNLKSGFCDEHDIKTETLKDGYFVNQGTCDEISNHETDSGEMDCQSSMTEVKNTEAVHEVNDNGAEDQHENQNDKRSRIHESSQAEDQEEMQDECTRFVDNQQEEDDGSQVDIGYEPDTAAHTEGEVSEEFQTEDEGNDDEVEHLTVEGGNAIPIDASGVAVIVVNDYSDNHMDAADDQTASDAGAESSGIEEGTCIVGNSQSASATTKPSILLENAFSDKLRSTTDCVGEELATDSIRNANFTQIFMNESFREGKPSEECSTECASAIQETPLGNFTKFSTLCEEDKMNSETLGEEMETESLVVDTIIPSEIQEDESRSRNEVATEADINSEPERVESQPESESTTDQYQSVRDRITDTDSDATDEFTSTHHSPVDDTYRTDYDTNLSESLRVNDEFGAAGSEACLVQVSIPPVASPAKVHQEKSISCKEEQEFSAAVNNMPIQPNLSAPVQEVSQAIVVDAFCSGAQPFDEFKLEQEVVDVDLSVGADLNRLHVVAAYRPLLLRDTLMDSQMGDKTNTDVPSDVPINEDENDYHGVQEVNNPSFNRMPLNTRANLVFSRDRSLIAQSGNPNVDSVPSRANQLILDKLPLEKSNRAVLIRDLPTIVQRKNVSDDQSLSMDEITGEKEFETKNQSDASIVPPSNSMEWESQSVHSTSENRDTAAATDIIVESSLNYEIEEGRTVENSSQEKVISLLSSELVPYKDQNKGASDDDMAESIIVNETQTESKAGLTVSEVLANDTEKEISTPCEGTDLTDLDATTVNDAISPVRESMVHQLIDNLATIQNPTILLHEIKNTSVLYTVNENNLSEQIVRSDIDNIESSPPISEVIGSKDETQTKFRETIAVGNMNDDVTSGAGQSTPIVSNNEASSAEVNNQINYLLSANDTVDVTARIDEQRFYERQNIVTATGDTVSHPKLKGNKTSDYQGTKQSKYETTPSKADIVEGLRVPVNTKTFKSPLFGLLNTAGRGVLEAVRFLSPFKSKHGFNEELEITTKRNDDEELCLPQRCLQTVCHDHTFDSGDLVHCSNSGTDREEVSTKVKEFMGTQTHDESIPPYRATRSRSIKSLEKEGFDSSSSQQPTRGRETKSRASTRVRKTAQPKKSKENTPASRRSSRRSEAFAFSLDDGDVKSNREVESNMEGLLVAFESQFSASPALSSIAPSSMASNRTRRRNSGVDDEAIEDGLRNNSTIVVSATAVFNDIEFELQLPTISEIIEEGESGMPHSKNTGMSWSNEVDDASVQPRLRKRVHLSKSRVGTEKVSPVYVGSSSKRPKGFRMEVAEEGEAKLAKAPTEFSPKKKRGRPAKSDIIKEDMNRKEKESSLKSPKKAGKVLKAEEAEGNILKEPAEFSARKKRGRPAKSVAVEEVQEIEEERYSKRAKESGMEPKKDEAAFGTMKELEGGEGEAKGKAKALAKSSPRKKRGRPVKSHLVTEDVRCIEKARNLKHPKKAGMEEKEGVKERITLEQDRQSQDLNALKRPRKEKDMSENEDKSINIDEVLVERVAKGKRGLESKFSAVMKKDEQVIDEESTDEPPVNHTVNPAKKHKQDRVKKELPVNTARQLRSRAVHANATDESSVVTARSTRSRR